jgi:two-component system NarL family sensor kinase
MRNFKIFSKIFISHTTIGLIAVIALSIIFYNILKTALIQRTVDQLSSINILKKNHIENYFSSTKKDITFILNQEEFINAYRQVLTQPTLTKPAELYLLTKEISDIQKINKFDNITIFSKDLQPIYSTSSDSSFLKILFAHHLADTSATQFRIIDASAYNPLKTPMLVYIVPLMSKKGDILGYTIIKENFKKIQSILHERTGMGNTGETYFAGKDFLMRSSSRFFPHKAPLSIKVETEAVKNAFKGATDENEITDYRGEKVLSVYRQLNSPSLQWVIISEIDFNEVVKSFNQLRNYITIITLLITLIILLITFFISNAISNPILNLKDIILSLSKGIIPQNNIRVESNDELGQITRAIDQLIGSLKKTTDFAHEIGAGNFKASYTTLSEKDTLGLALISMRDKLSSLNKNAVRHVREKSAALMEGQENERKRIVRELHDGVGQLLIVAKLRVETIEGQGKLKEEIRSLIDETIAEIRRISYNVMPSVIVDFGLEAALKGLCENIKKYTGLIIDFQYVKEVKDPLNFEISIAVFRIIQEGLNNVIKHAKASNVHLYVVENNDYLYFMLKDNGTGFDKALLTNEKGFGLSGMKERAELINGNIDIQSSSEHGTVVEVNIPLQKHRTS